MLLNNLIAAITLHHWLKAHTVGSCDDVAVANEGTCTGRVASKVFKLNENLDVGNPRNVFGGSNSIC